jgi:hypothetical protein
VYVESQRDDGLGHRDPSFYHPPMLVKLIWYHQRASNPGIAFKVFMFCWSLSRNWQWDSLRLFHFLPTKRAQELARGKFKGTYTDFLDAIRGMAATYGVDYDKAYGDAFLEMVNRVYAQQAGVSYSWDFLESTFNDLLHRFYEAARNPLVRTHLPGRRHTCKPIKLTPDQWGGALIDAFQALVTEFRHPSVFQVYEFRRLNQAAYGNPSYKDSRDAKPEKPTINPKGELDKNGKPTPRVVAKVDPPDFSNMICFKSFLNHYKIPSLKGEVPDQCDVRQCKRIHYDKVPKNSERQPLLDTVSHLKLVTESGRKLLNAAILADSKFK